VKTVRIEDEFLDAAKQALAALGSADVYGYQNSLCRQKAIDKLKAVVVRIEKMRKIEAR
jgi:hypothetical protein